MLRALGTVVVQTTRDKFGATALDWAAGEGHLEVRACLSVRF